MKIAEAITQTFITQHLVPSQVNLTPDTVTCTYHRFQIDSPEGKPHIQTIQRNTHLAVYNTKNGHCVIQHHPPILKLILKDPQSYRIQSPEAVPFIQPLAQHLVDRLRQHPWIFQQLAHRLAKVPVNGMNHSKLEPPMSQLNELIQQALGLPSALKTVIKWHADNSAESTESTYYGDYQHAIKTVRLFPARIINDTLLDHAHQETNAIGIELLTAYCKTALEEYGHAWQFCQVDRFKKGLSLPYHTPGDLDRYQDYQDNIPALGTPDNLNQFFYRDRIGYYRRQPLEADAKWLAESVTEQLIRHLFPSAPANPFTPSHAIATVSV